MFIGYKSYREKYVGTFTTVGWCEEVTSVVGKYRFSWKVNSINPELVNC